jgi:hypothetical protein
VVWRAKRWRACSRKPLWQKGVKQNRSYYQKAEPPQKSMSAPQQFFVRSLDNKSHTVTLDPGLTVRQVKEAIAKEKGNIPADQIRLVFGGKELQDSSKIADYNIGPGSNVNMVLRLQGGIQMLK